MFGSVPLWVPARLTATDSRSAAHKCCAQLNAGLLQTWCSHHIIQLGKRVSCGKRALWSGKGGERPGILAGDKNGVGTHSSPKRIVTGMADMSLPPTARLEAVAEEVAMIHATLDWMLSDCRAKKKWRQAERRDAPDPRNHGVDVAASTAINHLQLCFDCEWSKFTTQRRDCAQTQRARPSFAQGNEPQSVSGRRHTTIHC